jgi:hypothetical protein
MASRRSPRSRVVRLPHPSGVVRRPLQPGGQFLDSQTPVEQQHIVDAFVFELSKVETPAIRERMVANLRNVEEQFAARGADGLGLLQLPPASSPAREPIPDLPASPALSILLNGPADFGGRKLGVLAPTPRSSPRCAKRSTSAAPHSR